MALAASSKPAEREKPPSMNEVRRPEQIADAVWATFPQSDIVRVRSNPDRLQTRPILSVAFEIALSTYGYESIEWCCLKDCVESIRKMNGRGGGDRTRSPIEFVMIYRAQAEIGMWPPRSQQTACRHRYSIVAFYRLDNSASPRTAMRFTVWDVGYNPTTRSRNAEPASLVTGQPETTELLPDCRPSGSYRVVGRTCDPNLRVSDC
jgi:hypothetical protein